MNSFFTQTNKSLVFVTALTLTGLSTLSYAGEMVDRQISSTNISNVTISTRGGNVKIIGWDKNEITVKGELDDKAKALIFEKRGSQFTIEVVLPNSSRWRSHGSDLTIHMPKNIKMKYSGVSADVDIENLIKSAEVKTVSGDINARELAEHVELNSVSGTIKSFNLSGKVSLSVVSGDIEDSNSSGRLQLQAVSGEINSSSMANEVFVNNVSGDVDISLKNTDEYRVSVVSGDVESKLNLNENGVVKVSSVSGNVELAFQENIQADFRLKANAGGRLTNKVTSDKAQHAKYGPSSKLYFQTGNASGSVRVSTVSGNVKVIKK